MNDNDDKPNDYSNLYMGYQIQAAEAILDPDEASYYRKICRWYSTKFHTPLMQVYQLSTDHVLTNYYESIMENMSYNDLYDQVKEDHLPELVQEDDQDNAEYARQLEEEQAITIARQQAKRLKDAGRLNPPTIPQQKQQSLTSEDQSPQPGEVSMKFDDPQEP
jgi:uncharacterized protein (DUF885 family)